MSQLVSSIGIRRVQTLSGAINRLQTNNQAISSRNYSASCCSSQKNAMINNINKSSSSSLLLSKPIDLIRVPQRSLYSIESLGLDKVKLVRENKLELYQTHKDRYIERLASYLEGGNVQSILQDDLTNLIGLAENEQHLDLIERIVSCLKSGELQFGPSGWGTAVVRTYCSMDLVDRAYNNIKDHERFGEFFNQYTAYKIVMVMLYNAQRFEHVVEIFGLARERYALNVTEGGASSQFPGLAIVAFAALAKINTPEALEQAEKIFNEIDLSEINNFLRTKTISFLAYMAVNHDKPAQALNLISNSQGRNYITLRELKTISLLKLKRFEDIVYHLRDSLNRKNDTTTNVYKKENTELILKATLEAIEKSLGEIDDPTISEALIDVLNQMKQSKFVGEQDLESIIFLPIGNKNYTSSNSRLPGFKQESMHSRQRDQQQQHYNTRPQNNFRPQYNSRSSDNNNNFNNKFVRFNDEDDFGGEDGDEMRFGRGGGGGGQRRRGSGDGDFGRRGSFNDRRRQKPQNKSYFEEDMDDGEFQDENAVDTQKRFR